MSNIKKSTQPEYGSNRFAAGLIRNIYKRKLSAEDIMELKNEMESDEFKREWSRLHPQIQREVQDLLPYAEQHGALKYLINFVYGFEGEDLDPFYMDDLREHIHCWDNRDALLAAVIAKGAEVKREYGLEREVDELIETVQSLKDLAALSYAYQVLTGALVNLEHLNKNEIGERLNEAIDLLNAW